MIIEDGTGKPDAESYATAQELADYAVKYGVKVPSDTVALEALLRRAALAMEVMSWKGHRSSANQALTWPRNELHLDGTTQPHGLLPDRIRYGQMALASELHANDLNPPETRKGAVIRERVEGAVEREYADVSSKDIGQNASAATCQSAMHFSSYREHRGLWARRV